MSELNVFNPAFYKAEAERWMKIANAKEKLAADRNRTIIDQREELRIRSAQTALANTLMMVFMLRAQESGLDSFCVGVQPDELVAAGRFDAEVRRTDDGGFTIKVEAVKEDAEEETETPVETAEK